jgi:NADPH:quinone reductase-like Zn-dependent oxidoreductase
MSTMKAIRIHSYGGTDVLTYEDAPRPIPGKDDVLIRVHATTVNPFDCAVRANKRSG